MKTIRCAGLTYNGTCSKQQECSHFAKWWEVEGVEFRACADTQALKHFTPIIKTAVARPRTIQQELFA